MALPNPPTDRSLEAVLELSPSEFSECLEQSYAVGSGIGMDPASWQKVVEILNALVDLQPPERSAYLHRLRSYDGPAYEMVEKLLTSVGVQDSIQQHLLIGKQLGSYHILSVVGIGGMGIVYRAHDAGLNRDVAIKVLHSARFSGADDLLRFQNEAHATASLNHPNIVTIHASGIYEGMPYLVTELLEGKPLRALLKAGALQPSKALEYAPQIARGLAAAHDRGIVHRDIKPENLFVISDDRIKILDFGLAKLKIDGPSGDDGQFQTKSGMIVGTFSYMSPEQLSAQASFSSDIWSWGVVLYEMLAGRRPFKGSGMQACNAILNQQPEPPCADSELNRIVLKALSKSPKERHGSMHEVVRDLEKIQENIRQSGVSKTNRQIAGQPLKSLASKKTFRIAVAFLVIALGVTLVLVWRGPSSPVAPHPDGIAQSFRGPAISEKPAPIQTNPGGQTHAHGETVTPSHSNAIKMTVTGKPAEVAQIHLRSEPATLSTSDATKMTVTHDFYHAHWNATGRGLAHQYEVKAVQNESVVVDIATGLMWQKGGSSSQKMDRHDAEGYIQSLNARKLGGFDDWRLPTLEEAMSLMTAPENSQPGESMVKDETQKGLYHISPKFDVAGAYYMLTSDLESAERSWVVFFWDGSCSPENNSFNSYVRAVRTTR